MQNTRPNYFTGQFLKESDFQLEQNYHLDAERLHNRLSHTPGIAEGFRVTFSPSSATAEVSSGVAIDPRGRVIYLGLGGANVTFSDRTQGSQYIVIYYHESFSNETSETGVKGFTRIDEAPLVEVSLADPGPASDKIVIAKVDLNISDTNLTIRAVDESARRVVGAIAGESLVIAKDPLAMNASSEALRVSGDALFSGSLSVASFATSGDAAIDGSASVGGSLSVGAGAVIDGSLSVGSDLTVTGNLEVKGTTTTVNTTEVEMKDNIIRVNKYAAQSTPKNINGGLEVFRGGTAPEAQIIWNENKKKWMVGQKGELAEIPVGPLSVDANGNVGIGTTTPVDQLHIRNEDGADKYSGLRFKPANTSTTGERSYHRISGFRKSGLWISGSANGSTYAKSHMFFKDEGIFFGTSSGTTNPETNRKLSILNNGNIGVGTDSPNAKLEVAGNAIFSNTQIGEVGHGSRWAGFSHKNSVGTLSYSLIHSQDGIHSLMNIKSGGGYLGFRVDNSDKMVIRDTGNVGIGTTDPKAKLTVKGHLVRSVQVATGLGPNDGTDNGRIMSRTLVFTKHYSDTSVKVTYNDVVRCAYGIAYGAARWEIRFNGQTAPGGSIHHDRYTNSGDYHYSATIIGFATGLPAGQHEIQIWVGPRPGYAVNDCYTGWNNSRWTIEAQEVWVG